MKRWAYILYTIRYTVYSIFFVLFDILFVCAGFSNVLIFCFWIFCSKEIFICFINSRTNLSFFSCKLSKYCQLLCTFCVSKSYLELLFSIRRVWNLTSKLHWDTYLWKIEESLEFWPWNKFIHFYVICNQLFDRQHIAVKRMISFAFKLFILCHFLFVDKTAFWFVAVCLIIIMGLNSIQF